MRKLNVEEMEEKVAGNTCTAVSGAIMGIGLSAFYVPTPLNIAFGSVVTLVGGLSYLSC